MLPFLYGVVSIKIVEARSRGELQTRLQSSVVGTCDASVSCPTSLTVMKCGDFRVRNARSMGATALQHLCPPVLASYLHPANLFKDGTYMLIPISSFQPITDGPFGQSQGLRKEPDCVFIVANIRRCSRPNFLKFIIAFCFAIVITIVILFIVLFWPIFFGLFADHSGSFEAPRPSGGKNAAMILSLR